MRASIYKWKCHVIVRYSVVFIQDSLYCALPIGLFLVECLGPPVAELKLILCTACLRNVKVPIPYLAHKEVKVLVAQLCLTFCNPIDCSLPGSSVHGIFQARMLEWASHSLLQRIFPTQGQTGSPALQAYSLPSEPLGKS